MSSFDPLYKVNPPLRTTEDILALREALAQGVIDVVATDHAPHPPESKDCSFPEGAFGMLGLETAFAVVNTTLVETGMISFDDVARIMSSQPAAIGGVAGYDTPFTVGQPAHLTLVDPSGTTPEPHGSLSTNNPYRGIALTGRVVHTIYGGLHTVQDGSVLGRAEGDL